MSINLEIMKNNLFFNYSSTAKIRILKKNCFYNENFPEVYKIKTEKLDFLVPKKAVIFSTNHVYIPMEYYRIILMNYYAKKYNQID